MVDYIIVEKERTEFQKLLNQWEHQYKLDIVWLYYNESQLRYHALIKRDANCPHGTLGGRDMCMKCRGLIS